MVDLEEVGPPPEHLSHTQKAIWRELIAVTPGVLSRCHLLYVELGCGALHSLRTRHLDYATPQGYAAVRDILAALNLEPDVLDKLMGPRPLPPAKLLTGWATHKHRTNENSERKRTKINDSQRRNN